MDRRQFIKGGLATMALMSFQSLYSRSLFSSGMISEKEERFWRDCLDYARWSPSPHNIQPWKLKIINANKAELYIESERFLLADTTSAFTIIGVVIFTEYMNLAASLQGKSLVTTFAYENLPLDYSKKRLVKLADITVTDLTGKPLFNPELIRQRRTSRKTYNGVAVSEENVKIIDNLLASYGQGSEITSDEEKVKSVLLANRETLFTDLKDKGTREELQKWLRYSEEEAKEKKDGLWSKPMEIKASTMKKFIEHNDRYNHGIARWFVEKKYISSMKGTRTIGCIRGEFSKPEHWVTCGKALAHLWLTLTEKNIYIHPFGSLITNTDAHKQFVKNFSFTETESNKYWFVFRMGYSEVPTQSMRLDIDSLIL